MGDVPTVPKGSFKCPRCGATTIGNYDNCPDCGLALNVQCPGCGETWRHWMVDFTFCPKCGNQIQEQQQEQEQETG